MPIYVLALSTCEAALSRGTVGRVPFRACEVFQQCAERIAARRRILRGTVSRRGEGHP